MIENLQTIFQEWLISQGLSDNSAYFINNISVVLAIIIISIIINFIAKKVILTILHRITKKTKNTWDDALMERKVFSKLSHLAPAIIIYLLAPTAFSDIVLWKLIIETVAKIYIVVVLLMVLNSFFNSIHDIYETYDISKLKPIKGYIQVVKIIIFFIGAIMIISFIINKSPVYLFGAMGAMTAVLMLIFKDTILGFVGSIQLSANDMLRPGDWISMPKYGADGDVEEITLTSVKVRNFDKTITTVPTYALITNAFQNWRGMEESAGRRIKRSIIIDMNSIKFCDEKMLSRFKDIKIISDYLEKTQKALTKHNEKNNIDKNVLVNGRRQTNIGIFRAYIEAYLRNNQNINQDMTFLIRQLSSSEQGLPIELYVFSKVKAWVPYEAIQADIFDHLHAVIPQFDLQVFQSPSGADFQSLTK